MNRFVGRFTKAITRPRKMYPLSLLFGLGFDTASEVALTFLAAGVAGAGLPFDVSARLKAQSTTQKADDFGEKGSLRNHR